eukprot:TRINITY_DN18423_c0_g1_i1.p2 TRINITY_DN18423_c0_g1~~TRINITY_DN18423_c0_g1_i1.p2  ORF type:complete len:113 (-),score=41.63 TRINITY_DN18423_c0_g1_i1:340-678(-)
MCIFFFFFQAEDGIRDAQESRGLGDVYKRQVRAHQVVEDGFEFLGGQRQLVTLFSAPNYCGEFDNAGGLMALDENLCASFQILKPDIPKDKQLTKWAHRDTSPGTPPLGFKR